MSDNSEIREDLRGPDRDISRATMGKSDAGDSFMISNMGEESETNARNQNLPLRRQAPPVTGLLPSCCFAWPCMVRPGVCIIDTHMHIVQHSNDS